MGTGHSSWIRVRIWANWSRVAATSAIFKTSRRAYRSLARATHLLCALQELWPRAFAWLENHFVNLLHGSDSLRAQVAAGAQPDEIIGSWTPALVDFVSARADCLMPDYDGGR